MSKPEDPSPPSKTVDNRGSSTDNRGANIGQQIVVHGNVTFGPMTVSVPESASLSQGSGHHALPVTQSPAKSLGIHNLGERPRIFEGRDEELKRLGEALGHSGTVAVVGLGGVGKSRLALEYAFMGDYDVRWWVRSGASASLQEDLVRLGQRRGVLGEIANVERAADEVLDWLSSTHERWLLVFDNAEGPDELRKTLGRPRRVDLGHVLITSRAHAWGGLAETIALRVLPPDAARQLLLQRSRQPDDGQIDALARALGHLPLALMQAAAYLENTGESFGEYIKLLRQDGLRFLQDPHSQFDASEEQTVAKTWARSFAKVRARNSEAAALLELLAFLDPDGVPIGLLLEHGEGLPDLVPRERKGLNAAVAVLLGFSLIDRDRELLRVHRLVQQASREALDEASRDQLASAVLRWMGRVFAYVPWRTPVSRIGKGIPEQVMVVATRPECQHVEGRMAVRMLGNLGIFHLLRGMTKAAREACQQAVDASRALENADAESMRHLSISLERLGNVQIQVGDIADARSLFKRSLDLREALARATPHNGQVQRDVCVALILLGDLEIEAGVLATARALFRRALATAEALARANPNGAEVQRTLCVSLDSLGAAELQAHNPVAARPLLQRALAVAETLVAASEHPNNIRAMRDLYISLGRLGDLELNEGELDVARSLFERSLGVVETLAKADAQSADLQRDTSISLERLGSVEVQARDYVSARFLFQRSLEVREALVKADPQSAQANFDVVKSLELLAWLAQQVGDRDTEMEHLFRAHALLLAMDARGQLRGYAARMDAMETITRRLS